MNITSRWPDRVSGELLIQAATSPSESAECIGNGFSKLRFGETPTLPALS